jgi:hypothetical protein
MQKGHKPFLYAKGGYQDDELAGSLIALTQIRCRPPGPYSAFLIFSCKFYSWQRILNLDCSTCRTYTPYNTFNPTKGHPQKIIQFSISLSQ